MTDATGRGGAPALLDEDGLDRLIGVLAERGYRVVGPTVRDAAITLGDLHSASDLPSGWGVEASPGRYRLLRRDDRSMFAHSAGPQSWKQHLHPPRQQLWAEDAGGPFEAADEDPPPLALVGVRGCDLAGLRTLDRVLGEGAYPDAAYLRRREGLFIVAVNCTEPGGVCFCASMGSGPAAGPGWDLALTEQVHGDAHTFVVDVGSSVGGDVLAAVAHRPADAVTVDGARRAVADAAGRMGRQMPPGEREVVRAARSSPAWQDVAERCLTCGNCTMVCPTCFCTTTEDVTDLTGEHAERWRHWASCFELDFSYLHGGSVRSSGASRYRQWASHKLDTWHDQFGTSGCVGCGRCIAWCPVGIDLTEVVASLAAASPARGEGAGDGV